MSKKKNKNQLLFDAFPQEIKPVFKVRTISKTQSYFKDMIEAKDITFGIGPAGTGKTHLASLMAMKYFIERKVDRIIITRPAVNTGDEKIGFLPGGINEKMDPYIQPIFDAFRNEWANPQIMKFLYDGDIEIVPIAYMRGRSLNNCFIIADEIQNCTKEQLFMLLTRLGSDSKMVLTGDPQQSDIGKKQCIEEIQFKLSEVDSIKFVEFTNSDVVRHPTVEKILRAWNSVIPCNFNSDNTPSFLSK